MRSQTLPGTVLAVEALPDENAFSVLEPLFAAAGGLTLSQLCGLTGLSPATVQNWVKRGWLGRPVDKRYDQNQVARVVLINLLRESMQLETITRLLSYVNGRLDDRSDDIVSDPALYGYLCAVLRQFDPTTPDGAEPMIRRVLRGYRGPTADAGERLAAALEVMVNACWSGWLKRRADDKLSALPLPPWALKKEE